MRGCGDCTACCDYFPIKALGKKAMQPCVHLADPKRSCNNCEAYATRPTVCRDYACMWIAGHGRDEDRPDRARMIVDSMTPVANFLRGVPLAEGAQDTSAGVAAVRRISASANQPVGVCTYGEAKLLRVVGRGAA